jgi:hypothetical protein
MSKPKAPTPPDPNQVAGAQTGTNVSTAIANTAMGQVNQVTPDGSLTYSATGNHSWTDPSTGQTYNVPQYTATTSLSPEAQAIRDQNNAASLNLATLAANQSGRADQLLSQPFNASGLPQGADRSGWNPAQYGASLNAPQFSQGGQPLPGTANLQDSYTPEGGFSADRQRVEDALMDRLGTQRGRDMEGLRTQLTNQGVNIGTEAYSRAMQDFDRTNTDMRTSAILASGQEQSRLLGEARGAGEFTNNARQTDFTNRAALFGMGEDQRRYGDSMQQQGFQNNQAIQGREDAIADSRFGQQGAIYDAQDNARLRELQTQLALRNQPINEITALMSGSQVNTPQFGIAQSAMIPTTDYAGIRQQGFNNQQANYQSQMGAYGQMMGGLFGLGSAAVTGGFNPFGGGGMGGTGGRPVSAGGNMAPSDIRLKADIEPIGQRGEHNWYSYRYVWDEPGTKREGVMAQEVMATRPDAVVTHPLGFLMVNYDTLGLEMV